MRDCGRREPPGTDALERALRGEGSPSQRDVWQSALSTRITPEPDVPPVLIVAGFTAFLRKGAFAFYVTD